MAGEEKYTDIRAPNPGYFRCAKGHFATDTAPDTCLCAITKCGGGNASETIPGGQSIGASHSDREFASRYIQLKYVGGGAGNERFPGSF